MIGFERETFSHSRLYHGSFRAKPQQLRSLCDTFWERASLSILFSDFLPNSEAPPHGFGTIPFLSRPGSAGITGLFSCLSSCCNVIPGFCIPFSVTVTVTLHPSLSELFQDGPGRQQTPVMV